MWSTLSHILAVNDGMFHLFEPAILVVSVKPCGSICKLPSSRPVELPPPPTSPSSVPLRQLSSPPCNFKPCRFFKNCFPSQTDRPRSAPRGFLSGPNERGHNKYFFYEKLK